MNWGFRTATSKDLPTHSASRISMPRSTGAAARRATNSVRIGTTVQLSDTLSWLVGRHSVKFGGDYRHITSTLTNPQTMPRGRFTFGSQYTSSNGASGTGDAFASFLLGFPNQIDRDFVDTYPN